MSERWGTRGCAISLGTHCGDRASPGASTRLRMPLGCAPLKDDCRPGAGAPELPAGRVGDALGILKSLFGGSSPRPTTATEWKLEPDRRPGCAMCDLGAARTRQRRGGGFGQSHSTVAARERARRGDVCLDRRYPEEPSTVYQSSE